MTWLCESRRPPLLRDKGLLKVIDNHTGRLFLRPQRTQTSKKKAVAGKVKELRIDLEAHAEREVQLASNYILEESKLDYSKWTQGDTLNVVPEPGTESNFTSSQVVEGTGSL